MSFVKQKFPAFYGRHKIFLTIVLVIFALLSWPIASIAISPSNDPITAQFAEWGRDHALGGVVTALENLQYKINPPKVGGTPTITPLATPSGEPTTAAEEIPIHEPLSSTLLPKIVGEGEFGAVLKYQNLPIIQVAQLRPDSLHTSYLSTVIWMSGKHVRFEQHPGEKDPGHLNLWDQPDYLTRSTANLIGAFNSGFKIKDSKGGYYQNSHYWGTLKPDIASLIIYRNGTSDIGMWGRDFTMSPDILSVRQNLNLLVDKGTIAANSKTANESVWGFTLGAKFYVWRSGIGVTASGDYVFAMGNALSAATLANLLLKAGAVRAMELDINPAWISFMWYLHDGEGKLTAVKGANFARSADRYFSPASRDFFAIYSR